MKQILSFNIYINSLSKLCLSISSLMLLGYIIIYGYESINLQRLLIVIGIQLSVLIISSFIIKKIRI
jgi:hypothetical protein